MNSILDRVLQAARQLGASAVHLKAGLPAFEKLNLPRSVLSLADAERGLVLVTGVTGSGKSTTLAAMVDYINAKRACHIVTIEDPIEFAFKDRRSVINQREIGFDTTSF